MFFYYKKKKTKTEFNDNNNALIINNTFFTDIMHFINESMNERHNRSIIENFILFSY
jgi:hypothetical protein